MRVHGLFNGWRLGWRPVPRLLLLLLVACGPGGEPTPCAQTPCTRDADDDHDGWTLSEGDCDDHTAQRYPGKTEVCDGIDNDCDEQIDEDFASVAPTYYPDRDRDGYGVTDQGRIVCDRVLEDGYAAEKGDCDDLDPAVNPSADELCADGIDNNCDDSVDRVVGAVYLDHDGDHFGVGSKLHDCPAGESYAPVVGDCDDQDPLTYPGAREECHDAIDSDCNGVVEPCGIFGQRSFEVSYSTVLRDAEDGPLFADYSIAGDIDQDGRNELLVGVDGLFESWEAHYWRYLPAIYWMGELSRGTTQTGTARATWTEDTDVGPYVGWNVITNQDLNGDGVQDIAMNALVATGELLPDARDGAYIFYGPYAGGQLLAAPASVTIPAARETGLGASLCSGDLSGDGIGDLVAYYRDPETSITYAYIYFGPFLAPLSGEFPDGEIRSNPSDSICIYDVYCNGDLDGDGRDDLVLSCPYADTNAGRLLIYYDIQPAMLSTDEADARIFGVQANAYLSSVSMAGDVTGDGIDDLLFGASQFDSNRGSDASELKVGLAGLFPMPIYGDFRADAAPWQVYGEQSGDAVMGISIEGDLNGDGLNDALVAAYGKETPTAEGVLGVFYAPLTGVHGFQEADAQLSSNGAYDLGGAKSGGDVDGDGYQDLVIFSNQGYNTRFDVLQGGPVPENHRLGVSQRLSNVPKMLP